MITLIGLLCAWAAAERVFQFNPIIMPSPSSIGNAFLANYKLLFTSGFLKKSDVCNGTFTQFCK